MLRYPQLATLCFFDNEPCVRLIVGVPGAPPKVSIILPCWRDTNLVGEFISTWASHAAIKEIIVAGVAGNEPRIPSSKVKFVSAPEPNRGMQLNGGARLATAKILLFHHVDSQLTEEHLDSLARAVNDPGVIGGGFYRKFDERHPEMRWAEKIERAHCRTFGTIYGDQSVFVRREVFARLGGFAPIPLMEDVEFSRRLRRAGKIVLLDPPMRSSPQRQIEQGAWRVTLRNLSFLIAFRAGVSPERLHRRYYGGEDGVRGIRKLFAAERWRAFRHPIDAENTRILRER